VAAGQKRVSVTLEPENARKLANLAERTHVQERTQESIEQVRRGETMPLSEL